jgi:hypothetical protein
VLAWASVRLSAVNSKKKSVQSAHRGGACISYPTDRIPEKPENEQREREEEVRNKELPRFTLIRGVCIVALPSPLRPLLTFVAGNARLSLPAFSFLFALWCVSKCTLFDHAKAVYVVQYGFFFRGEGEEIK